MYRSVFEMDEKKGVGFLYYWGVNLVQSKSVFFGVFVVLKVTSLRKSKMG
jgi:hypothetical protein